MLPRAYVMCSELRLLESDTMQTLTETPPGHFLFDFQLSFGLCMFRSHSLLRNILRIPCSVIQFQVVL